jgi:hypothetical protein
MTPRPNPTRNKTPAAVPSQIGIEKNTAGSSLLGSGKESKSQKKMATEDLTASSQKGTGTGTLNLFSSLLFWSENEKSDAFLRKLNSNLPAFVGSFFASLAMFILGITARGMVIIQTPLIVYIQNT